MQTLKDLCATFPKVAVQQSSLDNVAAEMFNPSIERRYIHSISAPAERYGVQVDQGLLMHHNEIVPGFENYGPNEQYLINKVLHSPSRLLYIVGGIGVGKTRFAHFLIKEVLPKVVAQDEKAREYGPCTIYYDFLDEGNTLPTHEDSGSIRTAFLDSFCDRIEAELYSHNFFDLEYEVGTIWDEFFNQYKDEYKKYSALSYIIGSLRIEEAEHKHLAEDYLETIEKRKTIRQKIRNDQARRISYLALLLQYTRERFFASNPAGLLLIVDNVDREPSLVQQVVKLVIKPFSRVSGGRTILNARQTTYYQQFFDDGSSDPVDVVPYCGPTPLDVLRVRLNDFVHDHAEYAKFYDPKLLASLAEGTKCIGDLVSLDNFQSLFSSLCGRSIRRSLLLAQNLINNSVYDPSSITSSHQPGSHEGYNVRIGEVLRAILVGTDDIFRTNPSNPIDNIFEVAPYPGMSYLLKLRILKLICCANGSGMTINGLLDAACGFGYTIAMICDAINELKSETKRLIWSDSVRSNFQDEKDLVSHGPTRLWISTSGKGYLDNLSSNIAYIQEVMLDTKVKTAFFGGGWKYDVLEDRFELILKFLTLLSNIDQEEVSRFVSMKGDEAYIIAVGGSDLVTKIMFTSLKQSIERILSSVIESQRRGEKRERFRDFKAKHLGIYEDRIVTLGNFEYEIFRRSLKHDLA